MLENHPKEIESEYVLDEGGVVSTDQLANGKLVFGVAVGEKQMLWLKLRAKGTAAHGSQPIPDNANDILLKAIENAKNVPDRGKPNEVVQQMRDNLGQFASNKFTAAIQRNTISLTTLRSGVGDPPKANVIPSVAEATLDCRVLPGVNAEEFVSEMKARINDPRVTIEKLSAPTDAGMSDSKTPVFEAIRKAAQKHYPGATVTPMLIPYGTDGVMLRKRGVKSYGLNPMLLDAATIATMHSDEERIPLDSFYRGMRVFYDVLTTAF
jgi:acetylornithine deacetylase/succinyl-diaminopimelate desuccinylase-like protein